MTTIALFDLDKTLIPGDSDHGWGDFLSARGYVDAAFYRERNDYFYGQYSAGVLDIYEYCGFAFKVLADTPLPTLLQWRDEYMREVVEPMIRPQAVQLVQKHLDAGHTVVLTTATNDFVTAPIAARFGIEHLIATRAEMRDGAYTGQVAGTPNFKEGKVTRAADWLAERGLSWSSVAASFAYSDSINDAPLLAQATFAFATNPDARLKQMARERHWAVLELFAD
ncbi:MAG: HAD family hydrolase [Formosimonas sp.]